jgi:hypothetical protein
MRHFSMLYVVAALMMVTSLGLSKASDAVRVAPNNPRWAQQSTLSGRLRDAATVTGFVGVAVLLVAAYRSYMQQWRRETGGQCQQCGYDLRASPERCPECGATRETKSTGC